MRHAPIIKVFMWDGAELFQQEMLEAIRTKLLDDNTHRQLVQVLNEHEIQALVIAPECYYHIYLDTREYIKLFFLPGGRPLTDLGISRLGNKVELLLEQENMGAREFRRENEAGWHRAYKFTHPQQNPVTQVFAELDARETP